MAEFKMNVTGTAFDILSSKLYQRPYHAIVRELVLNGIDAHRVAGYDGPVQIGYSHDDSLQNITNMDAGYWFCRDFGDGLTQIDVERIYTSFFSSTKKTDGEQIGCFGLGSKTPFSVTDEYFVISIVDNGDKSNEKTVYRMFKNGGAPQWEIVNQSKTLEQTGLEIRISYRNISVSEMNIATIDVVKNIVEDVELCGMSDHAEDNIRNSKAQTIIEKNYRHDARDGLLVNLNGYMYFIPGYDISTNISQESYRFVKGLGRVNVQMIVNATKNDVTLTPSREALHFDSKTTQFLKKAIPDTFKAITKSFFEDKYYNGIYVMGDLTRELFVDFFNDLDVIEKSLIAFEHRYISSVNSGVAAKRFFGNMEYFTAAISSGNPFKFIKLEGPVAEKHVRDVLPNRLKTKYTSYNGLLKDSLVAEYVRSESHKFVPIFATVNEDAINIVKKYNKGGVEFVPMIKTKSEKKAATLDDAFWKNLITSTNNFYMGNSEIEKAKKNENQYVKYVLPSTYFGSSDDLTKLTWFILRENNKFTKPLEKLAKDFIGNALIHVETNPKRYEKFLKEGYVSYGDKLKEFFTSKAVVDAFCKAKKTDKTVEYIREKIFNVGRSSFGSLSSLTHDVNFKDFNITKLVDKMISLNTGVAPNFYGIWGQHNSEVYNNIYVDDKIIEIMESNDFSKMAKLLYTYERMGYFGSNNEVEVLVPSFEVFDNEKFSELVSLLD